MISFRDDCGIHFGLLRCIAINRFYIQFMFYFRDCQHTIRTHYTFHTGYYFYYNYVFKPRFDKSSDFHSANSDNINLSIKSDIIKFNEDVSITRS